MRSQIPQFLHHNLCGQIPHKRILRKLASSQSAHRRIKSPATGLIRGADLLGRLLAAGMKVNANLHPGFKIEHHGHRFRNLCAGRKTDGISERDLRGLPIQ